MNSQDTPRLARTFGLLEASALNMTNMVGIGPFITIPLLMSAMGGPQAMLGWIVALLICLPDGMVWSELAAALPGSGGTYVYLREAFGRQTFGRLMAFLFIWQFIISGPLEIASGYIGFVDYLGYYWNGLSKFQTDAICVGIGLLAITLLYRKVGTVRLLTLSLWIGTLLTAGAVIVVGALHFQPRVAFDFPPGSFKVSPDFFGKLGAAAAFGVYDYLGYYDICFLGSEVRDPGRVMPRSILISIVVVALLYIGINLSILGSLPWREFVPADSHPNSNFIVSIFMERSYGRTVAMLFTGMVLYTAFGSVFALMLGYSRIPYAAALDGNFFRVFGRLHPTKQFPYVSLLVIGLLSTICSFFSLDKVIGALLVCRILVQFIGQIAAIFLLRKHQPELKRPYRIWLHPFTTLLALGGWIFLFLTSDRILIYYGFGMLAAGVVFFLAWSWRCHQWPFAVKSIEQPMEEGV